MTFVYTSVVVDDTAGAAPTWTPGPGGSIATGTGNGYIANGATGANAGAAPIALLSDVDRIRVAFMDAMETLSLKLDEIVNLGNASC